MKKALCFMLLAAVAAFAQEGSSSQNPVSDTVRQQATRYSRILPATAEAMPADSYSYKPTDGNMPFGQLMAHIANSNNTLCSRISGQAAPKEQVKESDGKDKIVAALKDSMEFCTKALADVKDSQLGEQVEMYGGRKGPKAAALIGLSDDWYDHYGAAAVYLRLKGILPPTAQRRPQGTPKD